MTWYTSHVNHETGDEAGPLQFEHWEDARDCILELLSDLIWIYPDDANKAYDRLAATQSGDSWTGRVGRGWYDLYRQDDQ